MSNSDIQTAHDELSTLVVALKYNHERTIKGVKSSHTAYRSQLGEVKKLADALRRLILQHQKSLPVKSRAKKVEPEAKEAKEEDGEDSGVASEPEEEPVPKPKRRGRPPNKKKDVEK